MSKNKKLVPKRRFKEFQNSDAWEQRELGEVVQITMGQSPLGSNYTENPSDYILVQGNADMKNGKVFPRIWTTQVTKTAEPDDIILSVRAPVGDVGKTDYNVVLGRGVAGIKGNEFIYQLLSKMKSDSYWGKYSTGSTFDSINSNDLKEANICIPSTNEQVQIGSFFRNLDQTIAFQQRKLEKMKSMKSAYLSEMFPAEGEFKPKRRFPGFTDDWEPRELGEVVDMFNGDRGINYPNVGDIVEFGIPFINAGDLQGGRVNLSSSNKITREKFHQLGGAKIQLGDIIYCLRGTLGKNAFVDNFAEGTVASSLVVLRPKSIVGKYLFQILNSDIEYRQRILCDEGAAQPNLSAKNLSLFSIPVPSRDEQEKLSTFFTNLDQTIAFQQQKLEKLQNIKKAYLKEMFI